MLCAFRIVVRDSRIKLSKKKKSNFKPFRLKYYLLTRKNNRTELPCICIKNYFSIHKDRVGIGTTPPCRNQSNIVIPFLQSIFFRMVTMYVMTRPLSYCYCVLGSQCINIEARILLHKNMIELWHNGATPSQLKWV